MKQRIRNHRLVKPIIFFAASNLLFHLTSNIYAEELSRNKFFSMEFLSSVSCNNADCVAVGRSLTDNTGNAIVSISKDQGKSWSKPTNLTNQQNIKMSALSSVSCTNNMCVAVGASVTNTPSISPLIMISKDRGISWSHAVFISEKNVGFLTAVNCYKNLCAAVGTMKDNNSQTPLSYFSTDGGITWSQSLIPVLSEQMSGRLRAISCQEKNCLAVGGYYRGIDTDPIHDKPMALRSIDGGMTWSTPILLPTTGNESFVELTSITCQHNLCTASGEYRDKNSMMQLPVSYNSQNGGASWLPPILFDTRYDGTVRNGAINSTTCENNHCVAIGSIEKSFFINQPVTYISEDSGITWSKPQPLILLPNRHSGIILGIMCAFQTCIAVGEDINLDDYHGESLMMRSEDGGIHWFPAKINH